MVKDGIKATNVDSSWHVQSSTHHGVTHVVTVKQKVCDCQFSLIVKIVVLVYICIYAHVWIMLYTSLSVSMHI